MSFRLPIPFPHIANYTDRQIVDALIKRLSIETNEFFYGKSYPVFGSLYSRFYTDCSDIIDFIHDIYLDLLTTSKKTHKCKLETFKYQCSLKNWIGVVSIHYCHLKYKRRIVTVEIGESDSFDEFSNSILLNQSSIDMDDVNRILMSMNNKRYRELIRYRYLENHTNEETAAHLNMSMDNYYNKHRSAKVQYLNAYRKEMGNEQ